MRSEYELSRASNIKKNLAMLNSLGFVSSVCVYNIQGVSSLRSLTPLHLASRCSEPERVATFISASIL